MKCGYGKKQDWMHVFALNEKWEYVAGTSYIVVRMCPASANFSPVYSFVMDRKSDDLTSDVRREIEKRFAEVRRG